MLYTYIFNEISPASAITAASSLTVTNAASYLALGQAGPFDDCNSVDVYADLVGATGGTLDVYVQVSPDEGATWYDVIHFAQLSAGHAAVSYKTTLSYAQQPGTSGQPVVIGKNASPALAANTTVTGEGFNRARLLFVAGSSTSAGANIHVVLCAKRDSGRMSGQ